MGVWIETICMLVLTFVFGSHTLYGCVDWNKQKRQKCGFFVVTPCMGVWIETRRGNAGWAGVLVTPCMGVWIETFRLSPNNRENSVTPCMGVWIETLIYLHVSVIMKSHPVWVCGLKQEKSEKRRNFLRHTLYGCVDWNNVWLKSVKNTYLSHPVWVCGLKLWLQWWRCLP